MIWDLVVDRGATTLAAFTRGRGAFAWPLPSSGLPTAVTVRSFTARSTPRGVRIAWRTGAENDMLGFEVWRGSRKVTRALVPARAGGSVRGAAYSVLDRSVRAGSRVTYRLRVVTKAGARSWRATTSIRAARP
jgi:hypothetical protein